MSETAPLLERLFSLQGKAALVTGAAGGVGRVLAAALAEAGAAVATHDRTPELAREAALHVEAAGGKAVAVAGDLGDVRECARIVGDAATALERLDVLVNCAATNLRKPIAEVTEEDYDFISAINSKAVYFLSQAAHAIMKEQGGGKIVHIGSINSFFALDTVSVYGLTKSAVAQTAKSMAVEWAPDNVQVNCIAPGFLMTPLSKPLWNDEKKAGWLRSRIPARRPGQPGELVGLTLLLASEASSYITGQTIVIDGGFDAGGSWLRDPDAV
jgi:NAD(P)-dependent dehydrogenase (short-subunit alcohol dehydrogenase family)